MPLADLPYRIEQLARDGRYAYLAFSTPRVIHTTATEGGIPSSNNSTKLRVLRYVNLCDGPSLWTTDSCKEYAFYVALRLFATPSIVKNYLSSPEVASFCHATGNPIPKEDDGVIITESSYLEDTALEITRKEYDMIVHSKNGGGSLENLEEMVCQLQGIDSLESLDKPRRRIRRKKDEEVPAVVMPVEEKEGPKKKTTRVTLREQFIMVQNTPSRVIDVSTYGDTMQHQRGKILDRVRNAERISQCTSLSDLFPIISDNIPAFERALSALGSRYTSRLQEFKNAYSQRLIKA